ncbi:Prenylated rab acceptor PRA1 [Corchorus capsularis]|uniref:Prenylated rab acceptor PRA1 n=2 Tax=Malvaceae TaxID=3629 RepID=A0A1R3HAH4_COCAP|nr:Prenylated rab acceptor PRA1 [Corchorus capsularis]
MASYLWRKYADYVYTKWERTLLWDMLEPYRRPKSFTPLVTIYIAAFYTGVIGSAITEQLYKEKYWEDHPGEAVPLMKPKFYGGPWKVLKGDVLPPNQSNENMTTYGTIPAELPPSSNFIYRAREQIREGLGTRRPWKEMVKIEAINLPANLNISIERVRKNAAFFRVNYVIIVLFLLFLTLLWHPVSLIVFIILMAAWLFLYFLRDDPVSLDGIVVDDRIVMMGLLLMTVAMLFLTDVSYNIIVGLSLGLVVILVHGLFRSTDDLFFVEDKEANRSPVLMRGPEETAPLPLKNAASSSFSVS